MSDLVLEDGTDTGAVAPAPTSTSVALQGRKPTARTSPFAATATRTGSEPGMPRTQAKAPLVVPRATKLPPDPTAGVRSRAPSDWAGWPAPDRAMTSVPAATEVREAGVIVTDSIRIDGAHVPGHVQLSSGPQHPPGHHCTRQEHRPYEEH